MATLTNDSVILLDLISPNEPQAANWPMNEEATYVNLVLHALWLNPIRARLRACMMQWL